MGMQGKGNVESHSRTSLLQTCKVQTSVVKFPVCQVQTHAHHIRLVNDLSAASIEKNKTYTVVNVSDKKTTCL